MEQPQHKHIEPVTAACLRHQGSHDAIGGVHHELYQWARERGVTPSGKPFTVFLQPVDALDWGDSRFEVCLPVPEGTEGSGEVAVKRFPAADVLAAVVEGPYSEIPAHYTEFLSWIDYEGAEVTGPPREVYLVHPAADGSGDPQGFKTEIQFPVRTEE
jgi:effector-binding domain-containing protein